MITIECIKYELIDSNSREYKLKNPDEKVDAYGNSIGDCRGDFIMLPENYSSNFSEQTNSVTRWVKLTGTHKGIDFTGVIFGIRVYRFSKSFKIVDENGGLLENTRDKKIALEIYEKYNYKW